MKEKTINFGNIVVEKVLTEEERIQIEVEKKEIQAQKVVDDLGVLNFLTEIKDNLWGMGEIEIKKDCLKKKLEGPLKKPIYYIECSLQASWPAKQKKEQDFSEICTIGCQTEHLAVTVVTTASLWRGCRYFNDDRYVSVDCFQKNRKYIMFADQQHCRFDSLVDDVGRHKKEMYEWFDKGLLSKRKNKYPLVKRIALDRKKIINGVCKKELKLEDLPKEWILTPQEKEKLKLNKPVLK